MKEPKKRSVNGDSYNVTTHRALYASHCSFTSVDPYTDEPSMDATSLINGQDGN